MGEEVTASLKRMLETMRQEVDRSASNISTAKSSSAALSGTNTNYRKIEGKLDESRGLVQDLKKKDRADRLFVMGAFGVLLATISFIVVQRSPQVIWLPGKLLIREINYAKNRWFAPEPAMHVQESFESFEPSLPAELVAPVFAEYEHPLDHPIILEKNPDYHSDTEIDTSKEEMDSEVVQIQESKEEPKVEKVHEQTRKRQRKHDKSERTNDSVSEPNIKDYSEEQLERKTEQSVQKAETVNEQKTEQSVQEPVTVNAQKRDESVEEQEVKETIQQAVPEVKEATTQQILQDAKETIQQLVQEQVQESNKQPLLENSEMDQSVQAGLEENIVKTENVAIEQATVEVQTPEYNQIVEPPTTQAETVIPNFEPTPQEQPESILIKPAEIAVTFEPAAPTPEIRPEADSSIPIIEAPKESVETTKEAVESPKETVETMKEVVETITETVTETETITEIATEPVTEKVAERTAQTTAEPAAETITEPATEITSERTAEPSTESITEAVETAHVIATETSSFTEQFGAITSVANEHYSSVKQSEKTVTPHPVSDSQLMSEPESDTEVEDLSSDTSSRSSHSGHDEL